jgi:hypothetical protein
MHDTQGQLHPRRADDLPALACNRPVHHRGILLAVTTGLRRSELFALKWKDLDFRSTYSSTFRKIGLPTNGSCFGDSALKIVLFVTSEATIGVSVCGKWINH